MLIFLENLAGGTLIRVGSLIRHCIVLKMTVFPTNFPHRYSEKHHYGTNVRTMQCLISEPILISVPPARFSKKKLHAYS